MLPFYCRLSQLFCRSLWAVDLTLEVFTAKHVHIDKQKPRDFAEQNVSLI